MTWFVLASMSALLSAVAAVLQKKVLGRLTAPEFSFIASVFTFGATLFVPFGQDIFAISLSTAGILLGKSLLSGFAFYSVMEGLRRNQISVALPLLGLSPAVTAVLSWLTLGEALVPMEWVGIGTMIVGTYLIERKPGAPAAVFSAKGRQGQAYILAALGLFAASSVLDRLLVGSMHVHPQIVLFYQHFIFCFIFGIMLMVRGQSLRTVASQAKGLLIPIIAIALFTVAYRLAQLEATKDAPVALVLAVKRTSILFATFFGGKLFADERLMPRLVGCGLIVGAGFLILRNAA